MKNFSRVGCYRRFARENAEKRHVTSIYRTFSILLLLVVIAPYAPVSGSHGNPIITYYTPMLPSLSPSINSTHAPITGLPLPAPPISIGSPPQFAPVSGVLHVAVIAAQF